MTDQPAAPWEPSTRRVGGAAPGPSGRTVRLLVALVVTLALLTAGVGTVAWRNYEAGAAWRGFAASEAERAEAAERALATSRDHAASLEAEIGDLEAELADVENRVLALAGEKAGAEDEALVAQETATRLAALSRDATETGEALRRCITLSLELTNDIVAAVNEDRLDSEATNARIAEVNRICGEAQRAYDALRDRVDALAS